MRNLKKQACGTCSVGFGIWVFGFLFFEHIICLLIICNQSLGYRHNIFIRGKLFFFCLPELGDEITGDIIF